MNYNVFWFIIFLIEAFFNIGAVFIEEKMCDDVNYCFN